MFYTQLSADQLGQLYELLQTTKQVYQTPSEIEAESLASLNSNSNENVGNGIGDVGGKGDGEGERNASGIPKGEVLPDLGASDGSGRKGGI